MMEKIRNFCFKISRNLKYNVLFRRGLPENIMGGRAITEDPNNDQQIEGQDTLANSSIKIIVWNGFHSVISATERREGE